MILLPRFTTSFLHHKGHVESHVQHMHSNSSLTGPKGQS